MKVPNKRIFPSIAALRGLDGTKENTIKLSGLVQLDIARNLRRLTEAGEDLEAARVKIRAAHKLDVTDPEAQLVGEARAQAVREADAEWACVWEGETEIVISLFKTADLQLDKNSIPPSVLSDLLWMIQD
jgi:hypothetical protein